MIVKIEVECVFCIITQPMLSMVSDKDGLAVTGAKNTRRIYENISEYLMSPYFYTCASFFTLRPYFLNFKTVFGMKSPLIRFFFVFELVGITPHPHQPKS